MRIRPTIEKDADDSVKENYDALKGALKSNTLPVFFTYIGAFPEYLDYITNPLVDNLTDERFEKLMQNTTARVLPLFGESLEKSDELLQWINLYRFTPAFYEFQKDIKDIFAINIRLAFIFVALREAVKGWAVGAKKLPYEAARQKNSENVKTENSFIYDEIIQDHMRTAPKSSALTNQNNFSIPTQSSAIEKNLLVEYLRLCRNDFSKNLEREAYVFLRVGIEKLILNSLPLFPNLINSPINEVIRLTKKYDNFSDLIYLLAENFPTSSVQRMIFSGYMIHQ